MIQSLVMGSGDQLKHYLVREIPKTSYLVFVGTFPSQLKEFVFYNALNFTFTLSHTLNFTFISTLSTLFTMNFYFLFKFCNLLFCWTSTTLIFSLTQSLTFTFILTFSTFFSMPCISFSSFVIFSFALTIAICLSFKLLPCVTICFLKLVTMLLYYSTCDLCFSCSFLLYFQTNPLKFQ